METNEKVDSPALWLDHSTHVICQLSYIDDNRLNLAAFLFFQ